MAITLRNKGTEALIRELGRSRGEGPSATITRLAREAKERHDVAEAAEVQRRIQAMQELMALVPKLSAEDKAAIDRAAEDMYDENGLPT